MDQSDEAHHHADDGPLTCKRKGACCGRCMNNDGPEARTAGPDHESRVRKDHDFFTFQEGRKTGT